MAKLDTQTINRFRAACIVATREKNYTPERVAELCGMPCGTDAERNELNNVRNRVATLTRKGLGGIYVDSEGKVLGSREVEARAEDVAVAPWLASFPRKSGASAGVSQTPEEFRAALAKLSADADAILGLTVSAQNPAADSTNDKGKGKGSK